MKQDIKHPNSMSDEEGIDQSVEMEYDDSDDDEAPLNLAEDKRVVRTNSADPEVTSLHKKWNRGKLKLQPHFQRQFVWDRIKSSRLIESVLLSIPIPIIYLAQEPDNSEVVIDGQQRLMAFFSFIDGEFPDGKPFRLSGMKAFKELDGKTFKELDTDLQDTIESYSVRTITILKDSDPNLKFEIFERLNSGSVPLNDMELRNCVFWGEYMELLQELASHEDFRLITGYNTPDKRKRMQDVELVLRFAAFYHSNPFKEYQRPMRNFMNEDMERYRHISSKEKEALRKAFKNSVHIIKSLFAKKAFHRFNPGNKKNPDGNWESSFNRALYDALMWVFQDKDKNQVYRALDLLREGILDLMASNEKFRAAITISTSDRPRVIDRLEELQARVDTILAKHPKQPRAFSSKYKQELYENDPTCALCGQQIRTLDDAVVDHIEQYWRGGETIPENGRLTHRYCNAARPLND